MPIQPEDLTVSGLPRSSLPGGIKADAAADLLERAAWDYRAALKQAGELAETVREQGRRIEELEAQITSLEAGTAGREDSGSEAIGKALLAATHAAEEIAVEARASAERITAEAEARATAILEQATRAAEERERENIVMREKLEHELAEARAALEQEQVAARAELELEREGLNRDREGLQELLERERAKMLGEAQETAETIRADARREVEHLQSYAEQLRALIIDSRSHFAELAESALGQLEGFDATFGSRQTELLDDLRPPDGEPPRSAVAGD